MNYRTISRLQEDVEDKVEGASVVGSNRMFGKVYQAFNVLFANIYPESLYKTVILQNTFDAGNNVYKLPTNLERMVDIKIGSAFSNLDSSDSISASFNSTKNTRYNTPTKEYSITYERGEKVLILDDTTHKTKSMVLSGLDDLSSITTLNVVSSALESDRIKTGRAIKLDLELLTSSAYVYQAMASPKVISEEVEGDLSFTLEVDLPNTKYIESITLEITDGVNSTEMSTDSSISSTLFETG